MTGAVRIEKYHGTGNDFLLVDEAAVTGAAASTGRADGVAPVADRAAFTATHCDRETGVTHPDAERTGADGVLFLAVDGGADPPRVEMTHVQPDGSVAEMCGNGVRCAALWAARELEVGADAPAEVVVVTPAGERPATVEDPPDGTATVTVDMGRPSFAAVDVPLAADRSEPLFEESVAGLTVSAVNTGVPHAVAFVEDVPDEFVESGARGATSRGVDAVDLEAVAPPVRHADAFPEGTNVVLAAPDGAGGFDQRTYERGVEGETEACGTGAVAVAAVARRRGLLNEDWVTVRPPGGALSVRVGTDGSFLRGPAEREFAATLAVEP